MNDNTPASLVSDRFVREARSFIAELIYGTDRYRQLDSVVGELVHEYQDRFLIELIQNAHDASTGGEISVIWQDNGRLDSVLYIGNQGTPFRHRDFESICGIGISDKDPATAIGNKGLGFRSILQVCDSPEIFSASPDPTKAQTSDRFAGLSFRFAPNAGSVLGDALLELLSGSIGPSERLKTQLGIEATLFESENQLAQLRTALKVGQLNIKKEAGFLNPFSLPLSSRAEDPIVSKLRQQGFVTVVRLPLNRPGARMAAVRAIKQVTPEYLLFMRQAALLSISRVSATGDVQKKELFRCTRSDGPRGLSFKRVRLEQESAEKQEAREYYVHAGSVDPHRLAQERVRLPNKKWHGLKEVQVEIALPLTDEDPGEGRISIFLPTQQGTGMPSWVNSSFYGDIARKEINFAGAEKFNQMILDRAAELLDEMREQLARYATNQAAVQLVDLCDLRDEQKHFAHTVAARWTQKHGRADRVEFIRIAETERQRVVAPDSLILPPRLMLEPERVINVARIRAVAHRMPIEMLLKRRYDALQRITQKRTQVPSTIAVWLEAAAKDLYASNARIELWQRFYVEAAQLLQHNDNEYLIDKTVLLTKDGRLLAVTNDGPRIFIEPARRRSADSRATPGPLAQRSQVTPLSMEQKQSTTVGRPMAGADSDVFKIPDSLANWVAFFSPAIELSGSRGLTEAGLLLLRGKRPLISDFTISAIIKEVLRPALGESKDSQPLDGEDSERHVASLLWGFRLWERNRQERGENKVDESAFKDAVRVPTDRGWALGTQSYFSKDWAGSAGKDLEFALKGRTRLGFLLSVEEVGRLLGFSDVTDPEVARRLREFLHAAGVLNQPALHILSLGNPPTRISGLYFRGSNRRIESWTLEKFPEVPEEFFLEYKKHIYWQLGNLRSYNKGYSFYRQTWIDGLGILPLEQAYTLGTLIASNLGHYENKLNLKADIHFFGSSDVVRDVDTLLGFGLRDSAWVPVEMGDEHALRKPADAWRVKHAELTPGAVRQRSKFRFIPYVPLDVARELERHRISLRRPLEPANLEDGIALLAELEAAHQRGVRPEHQELFQSLWHDALVAAARRLPALSRPEAGGEPSSASAGDLDTAEEETELDEEELPADAEAITERRFTGARLHGLLLGDWRQPEWRELDVGEDSDPDDDSDEAAISQDYVYFPDDHVLTQHLTAHLPIVSIRREDVKRQFRLLRRLFGSKVRPLSQLQVTPVVQGESTEEILHGARSLMAEQRWLGSLVLSVLAFGRGNDMSLDSRDYKKQTRKLRELRMAVVPKLALPVPLKDGTHRDLDLSAFYWEKQKTLLLSGDHPEWADGLAACFRLLFEAPEIEAPLMLVFGRFGASFPRQPPEEDLLLRAVKRFHIDEEKFRQVSQSLHGITSDFTWERLRPALGALLNWQTKEEEALVKPLQNLSPQALIKDLSERLAGRLGSISARELWEAAERASIDQEMALYLYDRCSVDLSAWNHAVLLCGRGHQPIDNPGVIDEYQQLVMASASAWGAFLRRALADVQHLRSYNACRVQLRNMVLPIDWQRQYWKLPSGIGLRYLRKQLDAIMQPLNPTTNVEQFLLGDTVPAVIENARAAGLSIDFDEGKALESARRRLIDVYERTLECLVSWWLRSSGEEAVTKVLKRAVEGANELLSKPEILSLAESAALDESCCIAESLSHLNELAGMYDLPVPPSGSPVSIKELMKALGIAGQPEKTVKSLIAKARERIVRQQRMILIAGHDYEMRPDGRYDDLAQLLSQHLPDDLGKGHDPRKPQPLEQPPSDKRQTRRGGRGKGGANRMTEEEKNLVGAIGEYLCFKYLLPTWLGRPPERELWVSKNSERFLGGDGNDSHGFDFKFPFKNKTWQLEVKSSQGAPGFIELTPNEIRTAEASARRNSSTRYTVVLVLNLADARPRFVVLGNPYDEGRASLFRIEPGSARVYFKTSDIDEGGDEE